MTINLITIQCVVIPGFCADRTAGIGSHASIYAPRTAVPSHYPEDLQCNRRNYPLYPRRQKSRDRSACKHMHPIVRCTISLPRGRPLNRRVSIPLHAVLRASLLPQLSAVDAGPPTPNASRLNNGTSLPPMSCQQPGPPCLCPCEQGQSKTMPNKANKKSISPAPNYSVGSQDDSNTLIQRPCPALR